MKSALSNPIFHDEEAARAHFEALRWPNGPVCPHCGVVDEAIELKGKAHRKGLYKCRACADQFTATIGTVYERSHIPLHKWLLATHLMCASKKGISAAQLHREMGFGSYRTAWFMAHRIREGMRVVDGGKLGGSGKIVEADETYYGKPATAHLVRTSGKPFLKRKVDKRAKRPIIALVERGGQVRGFHVGVADKVTVMGLVTTHVDPASRLHTDESNLYKGANALFASHETVKHSAKEYVRGDIHSNSAEGFFGVFKKGMKGVYQHCSEKHLGRYVDEFAFRHNTRVALGFSDADRTGMAVKGAEGKRLTYRRTNEARL